MSMSSLKKHSKSPDEQKKMKKKGSKLETTYYVLFYTQLSQMERKQ